MRKTFGQNRLGPDWTGEGSQLGEADDFEPIFEPIDVVRDTREQSFQPPRPTFPSPARVGSLASLWVNDPLESRPLAQTRSAHTG